MADATLEANLAEERAVAVRTLLRHPLLDMGTDAGAFRVVVRHRVWLEAWFETTCGWPLTVDVAAGFARLSKRAPAPDDRRPLLRARGSAAPFDRRRYQLLCLVAAELVRHPATTVGLLAGAVTAEAGLDTSRQGERAAFVDALRALMTLGALHSWAGDVDAFVEDERGNALLSADTSRLHHLLSSATAPSALGHDVGIDAAIEELCVEPRYGLAATRPDEADEDQRLRWLRHSLARKLLDDPAVHLDDLAPAEMAYLASLSGRRWLRERVADAGFELEERQEGMVAVDPDAIATDRLFPTAQGNTLQLALLLVDHLLDGFGADGGRRPATRSHAELQRAVEGVLDRFPGWARAHRTDDGPPRLLADAVDVLVDHGLVRREVDGSVTARPALARYRAAEPVHRATDADLFEELS